MSVHPNCKRRIFPYYESNDWLEISFGAVQSSFVPSITHHETAEPARFLPIEMLERTYEGKHRATLLQLPRQPNLESVLSNIALHLAIIAE
jgi:hypothetical protein